MNRSQFRSHRFSLLFTLLSVLLLSVLLPTAADAAEPDEWPQWRGPAREGIGFSHSLLRSWPENGPPIKWQVDTVGVGYSSVAVAGGRIFTQGDLNGVEHVIALSADDGKVLWAVQPGRMGELLAEAVAKKMSDFDKDSDGKLDMLESIAAFGWDFNKYDRGAESDAVEQSARSRAEALMAAIDANQDGVLDYRESEKLRGFQLRDIDQDDKDADVKTLAIQRTEAALKQLDKDSDGKISKQESRGSFLEREFNRADQRDSSNGNKSDELLTKDELLRYFEKFQGGRDGEVTVAELTEYFAKRFPDGDGILTAAELRSIDGGYRNGMGDGPRGTPTYDNGMVYVEGGNGHVTCLRAESGDTVWQVSLSGDFEGRRPGWGYSESPLVVGDLVIVTPGGNGGTLAALNKQTGKAMWRTESVTQGAHYSSPVAAEIHGVKQIVQFARESVFGVNAEDGKLLWSYAGAANGTANCATPIVHNNQVFASSAYGTGGGLCKISKAADEWTAEEVYFDKKMANHHGGIVRIGDYMYGFGNGGLICMHWETGKQAWTDRSVGKGSLIAADGLLFLLGENQQLALAAADPEKYTELGRIKLEGHGRPSWAHPAIAKGVLYIRDQGMLTAYDVSQP